VAPVVASLVVRDLIREARDQHPSFDSRRHPDAVLVRALSQYQRNLIPRIVRRNRTILTEVIEQTLPLPDFNAGITLPDFIYPVSVEVETALTGPGLIPRRFEVEMVPWQARGRYHLAAYIRNNTLYLTGSEVDWTGFTKLRFFYVPQVDAVTGLSSTLSLPNSAEPCLVAFLAALMARRGCRDQAHERPDAAFFHATWREVEDEFLDEMAHQTQAQTSVIREVF